MFDFLNEYKYYYDGDDLGLSYSSKKSMFKVWAPTAKKVSLMLYNNPGIYNDDGIVVDHTDGKEFSMKKLTRGIWRVKHYGDLDGMYYMYKVEFEDGTVNYAVDPYAYAVSANGQRSAIVDLEDTNPQGFKSEPKPSMAKPTDAIIYELHVRDFSVDENSGIHNKGKFLAFTEEGTTNSEGLSTGIDHLKELGVTHVHLLPVFDFQTVNELKVDEPNYEGDKYNWGYDPQNYNVPEGSYSTKPGNPKTRIKEFKQMVKALHSNGILIVMDVVYNHTYDTLNSVFNKIVPGYYYRTDDNGEFTNGSGTGNEIASEKPMVRKYIKDSLKFWVEEYDVDGFRFDLMGLMDLETMTQIEEELHEELDEELLIYGEPWQAGGSPLPDDMQITKGKQRDKGFAVFNDNFRTAIKGGSDDKSKGFATGKSNKEADIVVGLKGAIDDFTSSPTETINYVTAHDNLNLLDKVIKTQGLEDAFGFISIHEGSLTGKSAEIYSSIEEAVSESSLRASISGENVLDNEIVKRCILSNGIVLTSQGIPFIHAGDEILRTKFGDYNSYRSPDAINRIRWGDKVKFEPVFDYYKGLIKLRKNHPAFRMHRTEMVNKHLKVFKQEDNIVGFVLANNANNDNWNNIVVIYNGNTSLKEVKLPASRSWKIVVNDQEAGTRVLDAIEGDAVFVEALSIMVLYDEETIYDIEITSLETKDKDEGGERSDDSITKEYLRKARVAKRKIMKFDRRGHKASKLKKLLRGFLVITIIIAGISVIIKIMRDDDLK